MKTKKQQEAILAAVCTMRTHPAADEIYNKLKKDFPQLSLGTVYRNLNAFAQRGDIRRIHVPGTGDRFDFRIDAHEHMRCNKCGRVYDVDAEIDIKIKETVAMIEEYTLLFHGICAQCGQEEI